MKDDSLFQVRIGEMGLDSLFGAKNDKFVLELNIEFGIFLEKFWNTLKNQQSGYGRILPNKIGSKFGYIRQIRAGVRIRVKN